MKNLNLISKQLKAFILVMLLMTSQLNAQTCNGNLIPNGGFEEFDSDYTSGLNYAGQTINNGAFGSYAINTDAQAANGGFQNIPAFGPPNFMIVDGSTTNVIIREDIINCLIPGEQYTYAFSAVDVHPGYPPNQTPSIDVEILNQGVANPAMTTGLLTSTWGNFSVSFTAINSSVTIRLKQGILTSSGNDYGVDEISLTGAYNLSVVTTVNPCQSACSGSATAIASCGLPKYIYSWNSVPAQNVANAINLCAGNYTVTATDANNCSASANVSIICSCDGCNTIHNDCPDTAPIADQDCFWSTGGNSTGTVDGFLNYIGTTGNNNTPFRIFTHGTERIHINGDVANANGYVGIGTSSPQNVLEINSSNATPAPGQTGISGLRFTDLNSTHLAGSSNGKVLSVNPSGDVVLVNDQTVTGAVAMCNPASTNYLTKVTAPNQICTTNIWENSTADKNVGIGTTNPQAQLDIRSTLSNVGENIGLNNSGVFQSIGVQLSINSVTNEFNKWSGGVKGIYGTMINASPGKSSTGADFIIKSPVGGGGFGLRAYVTSNSGAAESNYGSMVTVDKATLNIGYLANLYQNMNNTQENRGFQTLVAGASTKNIGALCDVSGGLQSIAVNGISKSATDYNYGVKASSTGGFFSYGVEGVAEDGERYNHGVRGIAVVDKFPCAFNVGVYGEVSGDVSSCPNPTPTSWAGYFVGNLNIDGGAYLNTVFWNSDLKLKKNLKKIDSSLELLSKINCYSYNFKNDEFKELNLPSKLQYGFVAQEIKELLPELVSEKNIPAKHNPISGEKISDSYSILAVNYVAMIPHLVKAVQEQQEIINEQKSELQSLKNEIDLLNENLINCCNTSSTNVDAKTQIAETPVLFQNNPNPFMETTRIKYFLPKGKGVGSINVFTINGVSVKKIELQSYGMGEIVFEKGSLTPGAYIYNLEIDGSQIDSKWMVITE
ncbi:MAG: tail fiber domain-containing protein [Bacteroidia bacterium]|nr:tail fiber domain-containing protein [Bacteroidia bacterium]